METGRKSQRNCYETVGLEAVGFVNDEANGLALLDIVKPSYADVGIRVFLTALAHFGQHFLGAAAVEQRQFPHGPVVLFWGGVFAEFDRGDVALADHVLDLLDDLLIRQRGQVREGFVTTLNGQSSHGFPTMVKNYQSLGSLISNSG